MHVNRRALRQQLGSRHSRRAHTKHHTQKLHKVSGPQRVTARELRPSVAHRMKELVRRAQ